MRPPFLTRTIDTPLKRVGYVLFLLGVGITLVSLVLFGLFVFKPGIWGNIFEALFYGWPREFFDDLFSYSGRQYRPFIYGGIILAGVGYLLSYAYESTIGRLVRWIQSGR